jgi:tetratricopeptide (TPR) repeat protein
MTSLAPILLLLTLPGQTPRAPAPERPHAVQGSPNRAVRESPRRRAFQPSKETARRLFALGQALHAKGKYREAIVSLNEALRNWDRREIHFNIALCYFELRDAVGAVRHLRIFLKGASRRERKAVPRRLRRLRRKVGVLVVESNDARAEIWINGFPRGKGHVEWVVKPGTVQVAIHRPGATNVQRTLKARAGGTTYWDVTVNRIRVTGPTTRPRRTRLHWRWFAMAAGVAVAAAGAAVGLGIKTRSLHNEFDAAPSWDARDKGLRNQALTNVMWGVAGVAVVGAAVLAYFTRWKKRERPQAQRIVPVLTPTGFALTGQF